MKVLQVCYKLPYPPNDGGAYSLYNAGLSLLRTEGIDLQIIAMQLKKNKDTASLLPEEYKRQTEFKWVEIDNRIHPIAAFLHLFKSTSYFVDRFYSKIFEQELIQLIQQNSFDIIQLEHTYLGVYLCAIQQHFKGKIVLRAQNIEHKLWESNLESSNTFFLTKLYLKIMTQRLKKMETSILGKVDGLICLSEEDRNGFLAINSNVTTKVIPIGFDADHLKNYHPVEKKVCIYHLGSMDWTPNIEGVHWYLKEVHPILAQNKTAIVVHLAGKNMSRDFQKIQVKNIQIDGEIPDALEYLSDKPILIVPLLSGGGIRVKIIEALALGKVIISTSKGAEGLMCTHGKDILIADTPTMFAKHIADCVASIVLRQKLSANAQKLFESHYRLSVTGRQKSAFYQELIDS